MNLPAHAHTPVSSDALIRDLLEAGRLQEALSAAEQALAACDDDDRPVLLCQQCNALVTLGQPLQALRVATVARDLALAARRPLLVAESNLSVAFALQTLEEHERAIELTAECEDIARQSGDMELLARAIRTLAISNSILGRHEQALAGLGQAISLLEVHARSPARVFHARYSLITARSRIASAGDACESRKQALYRDLFDDWAAFVRDVEARHLLRLRAMALGNAGIAARLVGDFALALPTLERALREQSALGLRGHAAVTESHLGAAYRSLGRIADATAALTRAIGLLEGGNPRELASVWEELSAVQEEAGDDRAALHALKQTRAIEQRLRDDAAHAAAAKQEQRAEIARLAESWSRPASEDALTGLANRRAFDRALDAIEHDAAAQPFAIILLDLDHFKQVNDRFGHATGDAVLKALAALLGGSQRQGDLVARIGGEEIAVLLPTTGLITALGVAERILERVRAYSWAHLHPALAVTASAGVASSDESDDAQQTPPDARAVLARADQRLYAAKSAGRDSVVGRQ